MYYKNLYSIIIKLNKKDGTIKLTFKNILLMSKSI